MPTALQSLNLAVRAVGPQALLHPLKALQVAGVVYSGLGGGGFSPSLGTNLAWNTVPGLPGTKLDYNALAGQLWKNSAVAIGLRWIVDNISDAELEVVERDAKGVWNPIQDHPLLALLETPNEDYDGDTLLQALAVSYKIDGSSYALFGRGAGGRLRSLDFVPHWQVRPAWPPDGSEFISHYEYLPPGTWNPIRYEKEDVLHIRYGLDLENLRAGTAPLKYLLREVASDNEATTYTATMLANVGVPGAIAAPKPLQQGESWDQRPKVDKPAVEQFKSLWKQFTTGDNRGGLMMSTWPLEFTFPGFSPEQMALDKIRQVPEDRICASLGLSSMVLNLTSGAEHKTYANMGEAREAAYYECLMPMQKRFAAAFTAKLLRQEFKGRQNMRVRWNYERVRVLQEDEDAKAKRGVTLYLGGLITKNEGRELASQQKLETPDGDEFYEKPTLTMPKPPQTVEGGNATPESAGDAAALQNGRGGAQETQQGAAAARNGNGRPPVKSAEVESAAEIKARLGATWRERRRKAEEGEDDNAA